MKSNYDYKALGERTGKIRKSRGLMLERLAEKYDLSTAYIGHIE